MLLHSASHSSLRGHEGGQSLRQMRLSGGGGEGRGWSPYMLCVVRMTVQRPRLVAMSEMWFHIFRRATGSIPLLGSSRKTILRERRHKQGRFRLWRVVCLRLLLGVSPHLGPPMVAMATASFLLFPPE
jgi:hypothetical protein